MVKEIYQDRNDDLKEFSKKSLKILWLMDFQLRRNTLLNLWRKNFGEKKGKGGIPVRKTR